MKKYAIIMAGGVGSRFWPLSTEKKPKQLLSITGKKSLIVDTVERMNQIISNNNIFISTNNAYYDEIVDAVSDLISKNNIISEPYLRDTTACIGFALLNILKNNEDGVVVIVPSDAAINNIEEYKKNINEAIELASDSNKIITIGITPTYPATGYGYIKTDQKDCNVVLEFKEKPDKETAINYLASNSYLWNSGIIIVKCSVMLKHIKKEVPEIYEKLLLIKKNLDNDLEIVKKLYCELPKISIDYSVLEPVSKKGSILVVRGNFDWNDVGSWDTVLTLLQKDDNGNAIFGDVVKVDTKNCIIRSNSKLVATIGCEDLVIIETDNVILVCKKNRSQDVKKIVSLLHENGRDELL